MQNAVVRVIDAAAALDDKELQRDDGEIEMLRFKGATEEASYLADAHRWMDRERGH